MRGRPQDSWESNWSEREGQTHQREVLRGQTHYSNTREKYRIPRKREKERARESEREQEIQASGLWALPEESQNSSKIHGKRLRNVLGEDLGVHVLHGREVQALQARRVLHERERERERESERVLGSSGTLGFVVREMWGLDVIDVMGKYGDFM